MAANDDRWQARIEKKLTEAFELHARLHDVLLDIKRQLAGENPVRDVMVHFNDGWRKVTRSESNYRFTKIDSGQVLRLIKAPGVADAVGDLKARIDRYFADADPWLRKQDYAFNIFLARFNKYGAKAMGVAGELPDDEPAPPADCRHQPKCKTDIQHTKMKQRELRA